MKTVRSLAALLAAVALVACTHRPPPPPEPEDEPIDPVAPEAEARKFYFGEFVGFALQDGTLSFPNDNKVFAVGRTSREVAELLQDVGLPTDTLELSVQPLLVQTADRVLLFDTGAGTNMGSTAGRLLDAMVMTGLAPAIVTDIFISHVHGDHVGGLIDAEGALNFRNATIHISTPEWEFLKSMTPQQAASVGIGRHAELVAAITPKVAPFAPNAEIVPGAVKAVEVKGHTPGHTAYRITSGKRSLVYLGDTVHHFVVSVREPDWTIAFDADPATAQASRKAFLARSAETRQLLYAYHFPFPGLGKVKRQGGGFVWVAN